MEDFKQFLKSNFSSPVRDLSKTEFGNSLTDNDIILIDLDEMARKLPEINADFKTIFASADSLLISKNRDNYHLYFIEFKNIDFNDKNDRLMSKNILNNCISKMKQCAHNCNYVTDLMDCNKFLVDRYNVSLRSKPFDSLSLLFFFMEYFFEDISREECIEKLFNLNKNYIIVSKTRTEYNPLSKNKNNRTKSIISPLSFLTRLVPYHFDNVFVLSEDSFSKFLNNN